MAINRLIFTLIALAIVGIVSLFLRYAPHKQPIADGETREVATFDIGSAESLSARPKANTDGETESLESDSATTEQSHPPGFHVIDLTEQEKANLLQAPFVFLKDKPSETLSLAMESGRVDYIRADRNFDTNEYVTQGWIFYEAIDGQIPVILCLSQSKTIIDWMWCQEETRPETGRAPGGMPEFGPAE